MTYCLLVDRLKLGGGILSHRCRLEAGFLVQSHHIKYPPVVPPPHAQHMSPRGSSSSRGTICTPGWGVRVSCATIAVVVGGTVIGVHALCVAVVVGVVGSNVRQRPRHGRGARDQAVGRPHELWEVIRRHRWRWCAGYAGSVLEPGRTPYFYRI